MSSVLTIRDLHVELTHDSHSHRVLKGLDLNIPRGKTVAVVGESGVGKSLCGLSIMGLLPQSATITSGQILFSPSWGDVFDLATIPPRSREYRSIRGSEIGMVFQEPLVAMSQLHTIGDQISEVARLHQGLSRRESLDLTTRFLGLVGFRSGREALKLYPFELSGGMRQRAMIAMALICQPSLLIADEPTTALDATIQVQILKLLMDLQSELNMSILLITHDLGVVAHVASSVFVMWDGAVVESGPTQDILYSPQHPYTQKLLAALPKIQTDVAVSFFQSPHLLQVQHVNKCFLPNTSSRDFSLIPTQGKPKTVADDVVLNIRYGECLGLVGESGSGKSSLARMVIGALAPDQGSIQLDCGEYWGDVRQMFLSNRKDLARRIQMIFQDPFGSLNPRMTILECLEEPLIIHNIGTSSERKTMIHEGLKRVGLSTTVLRRYPHHFSGGQRQRIAIARALILQPELLICDEPTSALDVSIQHQILTLLQKLQRELGLSLLFISHNLAVVQQMADRIAVMVDGKIVELAPKHRLFSNPIHPYTQLLLSSVLAVDIKNLTNWDDLDFQERFDASMWPDPFKVDGSAEICLTDCGEEHYVRMNPMASLTQGSR